MAKSTSNKEILSADGSTPWIQIRGGANKIAVYSATWGGSTTLALEQSSDGTDAKASPIKVDGTAVSLSANDEIMVEGPGYIRGVAASYSGSDPISVEWIRPR